MNLLVILAIVLYGGTVWVGAVFYVEFRDTVASYATPAPMATYLYECEGRPEGMSAFRASRSWCSMVTSYEQKVHIHLNCNFYNVYRPDLQGHAIQLADRGVLFLNEWNLGYLNHAVDHPNFGEPRPESIAYHRARVEGTGIPNIVSSQYVNGLTLHFAQTNLIAPYGTISEFRGRFLIFATALDRITDGYSNLHQSNTADAEGSRIRFGEAMKIFLKKMIDPCRFIPAYDRERGSQLCASYCNFLNTAALHFGPAVSRCTSLRSARCDSGVCMCSQILSNPLAGCESTVSPMKLCNNAMRAKLNL